MGSGLNFRSRPLDIDRALPIYEEHELPDLIDACSVNRTVTKVPTGMEKEEESELDLQKALTAQKNNQKSSKALIPVPEVFVMEIDYNPRTVDIPPSYIGEELVNGMDELSNNNYDMDSEDLEFVNRFTAYVDRYHENPMFNCDEFETMMELMEATYKSSKKIERVMELIDKKHVNKFVFQHWEKKRRALKPFHLLMPCVRTHDKNSQNDPFVAFRKRVEKMQTRKNRKLDEVRYTNAIQIALSLFSATDVLDAVNQRECLKKRIERNALKLFYMRYNRYSSTNKVVEIADDDGLTLVDPDLQFPCLSHSSRKDPFFCSKRRASKIQFWRQIWKMSQRQQIENDSQSFKIYAASDARETTCKLEGTLPLRRYLAKKQHRFFMPKRQAHLLPLRERPTFKCQSRDEFVRKLYYAHCLASPFSSFPKLASAIVSNDPGSSNDYFCCRYNESVSLSVPTDVQSAFNTQADRNQEHESIQSAASPTTEDRVTCKEDIASADVALPQTDEHPSPFSSMQFVDRVVISPIFIQDEATSISTENKHKPPDPSNANLADLVVCSTDKPKESPPSNTTFLIASIGNAYGHHHLDSDVSNGNRTPTNDPNEVFIVGQLTSTPDQNTLNDFDSDFSYDTTVSFAEEADQTL